MSNRPQFILPAGLQLDVKEDTFDLRFDGDVQIGTTLGRKVGTIEVSGDLAITLEGPLNGSIKAGGVLTVAGDIDAERVHAREIVLGRQHIKCKALSADQRIVVGPATLSADVVIAPEIVMDPKAQGRVTVIESLNERGATKIKGGFSLADYEETFGNAEQFLAQRQVRRLDPDAQVAAADPYDSATPAPAPASSPAPAPAARKAAVASAVEEPPQRVAAVSRKPSAPPPKPAEEDVNDPLSVSIEDLEVVEVAAAPGEASKGNDTQQRLLEALGRITACYDGSELPPAVNELTDLIRSKDHEALRQNITEVWNGLLGFHQKRGIRPNHQVTHAFNTINNLVQQ